MYVCMYADLSYATVILQKNNFVVYWCWSNKMRRSWYWVDMLICILSSSHYFIAESKASFFVFAFKICLRHQSVTPFLGGASPPKKNPKLTNLYLFKGAVITASYNSSFGRWPVLIRYETWEIASELQNHSFVSSKYVFQGIISNVSNNKIEPWKTVRLTRFQKPQLQSTSIFFKFVHPCLFLYF